MSVPRKGAVQGYAIGRGRFNHDVPSIASPLPTGGGPTNAAPTNLVAPSIMGTPEVGQTLMRMAGSWSGYPVPTVSWQWTADGVDIPGETGDTLLLTSTQTGAVISGYEDASNGIAPDASEPSSNSLGPVTDPPPPLEPPVNTAAPTLMGTPEVGEELMVMTGTWTNSPDSYIIRWYSNTVNATSGATVIQGPDADIMYTLTSSEEDLYVFSGVIAVNAAGESNEEVFSDIFGPVTVPETPPESLSSTNPIQTSASGEVPFTFSITMGADIFEGYYLDIQRTVTDDGFGAGDYTSPTMDIAHQLTPGEHDALTITAEALILDGYTQPPSNVQFWQRTRWRREDGLVGPWGELSDTLVTSTVALVTSNGADKNQYIDVIGLTADMNNSLGAPCMVKADTAVTGKRHFEVIPLTGTTGGSGYSTVVALTDDATAVGPSVFPVIGSSGKPGWSLLFDVDSPNSYRINVNGGATDYALPATWELGQDAFIVEFDTDANSVVVSMWDASAGIVRALHSNTITVGIPAEWRAAIGGGRINDSLTINFGGSAFLVAPSVGYQMYG